jgi:branched-chain amino acid transport system substrate-binding protein
MSRRSRLVVLAGSLALVMAAALTGCSSGGSNLADGKCKAPLKIGVVTSITGSLAFLGEISIPGVKTAVKVAEDNGLVPFGCKLDIIYKDDAGDPAQALSQVKQLVEQDHVDAVLSAETDTNTLSFAPYLAQRKIVNLLAFATAPDLYDVKKYPYNFGWSIAAVPGARGNAQEAADLGFKGVVFATEDSSYGNGVLGAAKTAFTEAGVSVNGTVPWAADGTNLDAFAIKVKAAAKPGDVVYVCGQAPGLVRLFQSFNRVGMTNTIQGCQSIRVSSFLQPAAETVPDGTITISVNPPQYDTSVANIKRFDDAFQSLYNRLPGDEAWPYSTVLTWLDAVKRAGSTDGVKVSAALEATRNFTGGANAPLSFSKTDHISLSDPKVFTPMFLTRSPAVKDKCGPSVGDESFCTADTLKKYGVPVPTY